MKDLSFIRRSLAITFLSASLCSCVVVPKQVASYDEKCMVSTQKVELTLEQIEIFDLDNCIVHSCSDEIIGTLAMSTLAITTSAIVSGSVALIGNTLYWAESKGKCPNLHHQQNASPKIEKEMKDDEFIFEEKVITAKS